MFCIFKKHFLKCFALLKNILKLYNIFRKHFKIVLHFQKTFVKMFYIIRKHFKKIFILTILKIIK
jgi:hypothetical protein